MSKRAAIFLAAAVLACGTAFAGAALPFVVYNEANSPDNHYLPTGWMGDWNDIQLKNDWADNPRSGATCIQVIFAATRANGANWGGIYWQDPANNWGGKPGGFDLTGAAKLTFWARGEKGGEVIDEFRLGGISGEYFDSDVAYQGPIVLTPEWKQYQIDLAGKDLSSIKGGFMWSAKVQDNKQGLTFYLDDIQYE